MSSLTGENIIFVNILDVIDDGQIQVEGESPPDCVLTNDEFGILTWLPVSDLPQPPDPEPPAGYDAGRNISQELLDTGIIATLDDVEFAGVEIDGDYPYGLSVPTSGIECSGALGVKTGLVNVVGLGGGVPKFQIDGVSGTENQIITFDADDGLVFSSLGGGALTAGLNIDATKLTDNIVATLDDVDFDKVSTGTINCVGLGGGVPKFQIDGVSGTEKQIITFDADDGLKFGSIGGGGLLTAGTNINPTDLSNDIISVVTTPTFVGCVIQNIIDVNHLNFRPSVSSVPLVTIDSASPPTRRDGYLFVKKTNNQITYANPTGCLEFSYTPYIPPAPPSIDRGWSNKIDIDNAPQRLNSNIDNWIISDTATWLNEVLPAVGRSCIRLPFPSVVESSYRATLTFNSQITSTPTGGSLGNVGYLAVGIPGGVMVGKLTLTMDNNAGNPSFFPKRFTRTTYFLTEADGIKQIRFNSLGINSTNSILPQNNNALSVKTIDKFNLSYVGKTYVVVDIEATGSGDALPYATYKSSGAFSTTALL